MKILRMFFPIAISIAALFTYSCTKDYQEELYHEKSNGENLVQLRSVNLPFLINGMLHFDSYSDFEKMIEELEIREQDSTKIKNAYVSLGFDLRSDSIPNLTDNPVCMITERKIKGFISSRLVEENRINSALNKGEDVFSIILNPYLKTLLNGDNSVHIGTRIFRFFDNGGIAIVLNNDWDAYYSISSLPFDKIEFSHNIVITSDSKNNWESFYNFNSENKIIGEKKYSPKKSSTASPLYCDFSDNMIVTNLNNGKLRIELDFPTAYDVYEWTFEDGSKSYDYPLIIDCAEMFSGLVELDVWMFCPECPTGHRRICRGRVKFECDCGEKKTVKRTLIQTVNGQKWKIDAAIWVKSGNVGCKMKYLRKFWIGWFPAFNEAVCTDIKGTYKRETESCTDVFYSDQKCLGPGTFPISISVSKSDIPSIFREPNELDSGHRVKVNGTWFGFGVGSTPRLVLD